MKAKLKKFRINSLTYESIDSLEKIIGEDAPKQFQAHEKRSIESEYSLKNDKTAILVSSEIKLNTVPENTELTDEYFGIQSIICDIESIFDLTIDEDEKENIEKIGAEKLIDVLQSPLDIVVEMKSNEILNFMANNGPWGKTENYTVSFDVDISHK